MQMNSDVTAILSAAPPVRALHAHLREPARRSVQRSVSRVRPGGPRSARMLLDPLHQIRGHRPERLSPRTIMCHPRTGRGQVHHGLPGRVTTAHHDHRARPRTARPRCVPRRSTRRGRAAPRRRPARAGATPSRCATITMSAVSSSAARQLRARHLPWLQVAAAPRRCSSRSSAPKRSAWRPASRASSAPPMPSTKPKKFSISRRVATPGRPGTSASATAVDSPSEAAVHRRREAGRARADDDEVVVLPIADARARPRRRRGPRWSRPRERCSPSTTTGSAAPRAPASASTASRLRACPPRRTSCGWAVRVRKSRSR